VGSDEADGGVYGGGTRERRHWAVLT